MRRVEPVVIACGFQSPEGPSFDQQGHLHFVDWDAAMVYRRGDDGAVWPFVKTGGTPTGSKFGRDGHLFVADGALGILDVAPDGSFRVAAAGWKEGPFRGPNDLVFAPNGDLYFTDPKGSGRESPTGNIFILRQSGAVELFAGGFRFPNGIVLSDDGQTLYLAETSLNRVLAFELDASGHERARRVYAQLDGGAGPDGMAFSEDGHLFAAHFGKGVVSVISPQGKVVDEIPAGGARPTNVAFWGESLYVTEVEHRQVVRLDIGVRGQRLYSDC
ncbi:MAG TPA: SMP-30/gluconolactonase/LRE family protein [Anaerolineae bacterium]|nr:SMP-30/gluconolactonase/LRE family protein [Anaerolineae bacterium]